MQYDFDVEEEIAGILEDKKQELFNLQNREVGIEAEIEALEIVLRMLEKREEEACY